MDVHLINVLRRINYHRALISCNKVKVSKIKGSKRYKAPCIIFLTGLQIFTGVQSAEQKSSVTIIDILPAFYKHLLYKRRGEFFALVGSNICGGYQHQMCVIYWCGATMCALRYGWEKH